MKFGLIRKIGALALAVLLFAGIFTACEITEDDINDIINIIDDVISETDAPDETAVSDCTAAPTNAPTETPKPTDSSKTLDKHGSYTTKEDVALYIHIYRVLPENFVTKEYAESIGWTGGSMEPYESGKCIGGSYFGNFEGRLPKKEGREYHECDIDTLGKSKRGEKRIVYSTDGLIYYTDDHYKTFELLYGEE